MQQTTPITVFSANSNGRTNRCSFYAILETVASLCADGWTRTFLHLLDEDSEPSRKLQRSNSTSIVDSRSMNAARLTPTSVASQIFYLHHTASLSLAADHAVCLHEICTWSHLLPESCGGETRVSRSYFWPRTSLLYCNLSISFLPNSVYIVFFWISLTLVATIAHLLLSVLYTSPTISNLDLRGTPRPRTLSRVSFVFPAPVLARYSARLVLHIPRIQYTTQDEAPTRLPQQNQECHTRSPSRPPRHNNDPHSCHIHSFGQVRRARGLELRLMLAHDPHPHLPHHGPDVVSCLPLQQRLRLRDPRRSLRPPGVLITVLFAATAFFSCRSLMTYKRTGLVPLEVHKQSDFSVQTQEAFSSNNHTDEIDDEHVTSTDARQSGYAYQQSPPDDQYAPIYNNDPDDIGHRNPAQPISPLGENGLGVKNYDTSYGGAYGQHSPVISPDGDPRADYGKYGRASYGR